MSDSEVLARRVNNILTSYIAVHNEVYPRSLRALFRMLGFLKPPEFGPLEERLVTLQGEVFAARDAAAAAREDASVTEEAFMAGLTRYCVALHEAMDHLRSICVELHKKSRIRSQYRWRRYRKDLKSYQSAIHLYRSLGVELNELFQDANHRDDP